MKYIPSQLRRGILACTGALLSTWAISAEAAVIYNFDDLNLGSLTTSNTSGQDGWYRDAALGGPDLQVVTAPSGSSTTNAITVAYGNTSERALRHFGESFFSGSETNAEITFTFQKTSLLAQIQFALGNGSTAASNINGNSPSSFSPKLVFQGQGGNNTFGITPKTTSGNFGTSVLSSAQSLTNGNWYTVVMSIDFTANNGDGSASVSLIDLTNNVTFSNLVSGVNLGLTNNPGTSGPEDWNQAWIRLDQVNNPGPTGAAVFTEFSINPVPEPNTAATVAATSFAFLFLLRRRSRSAR